MCDSQGESVSCRVLAVTYIPAWIRPLLSAGESNPLHAHWNSYKLTKLVISCGMSLPESLKVTNCSWPFPVTLPAYLRHGKCPAGHFPWHVPTRVTQMPSRAFPVTRPYQRHAKCPAGHFPWHFPTCVTQSLPQYTQTIATYANRGLLRCNSLRAFWVAYIIHFEMY